MKMKKIILILLVSIPLVSFAEYKSGIDIVSMDKMGKPQEMYQKDLKESKEYKQNGFILKNVPYAKTLLSTKDSEKEILNSKKYVSDPYDTHIKKMLSAIKLNFEFNGIAKFHQGETIGYAPAGTYENGWTGIAEFFYRNDLGTCEFVKEKINYMMISKDDVTYQVNDKITMTNIEGSNNSGYTYKVGWYFADENKMVLSQELECANMKFDKKIMANMITLANRIDK